MAFVATSASSSINVLETLERVRSGIFLGDHFGGGRLALHGVGDRVLGRLIVVVVDLLIIFGSWMDEDAANDQQIFCLILRNDAFADAVRNGFGNRSLCRAEHLQNLLDALHRYLGDHNRRRLDGHVWLENCQKVRVTFALIDQSIGECGANRAVFAANHEVDVSDFVAVSGECFADVELHVKNYLQTRLDVGGIFRDQARLSSDSQ